MLPRFSKRFVVIDQKDSNRIHGQSIIAAFEVTSQSGCLVIDLGVFHLINGGRT